MRQSIILFAGLSAVSAVFSAEPVGRSISSVTVPLDSVTVQLDAVTIDEAMVRTSVSPAPLSQIKLVEMAQSPELLESKRV